MVMQGINFVGHIVQADAFLSEIILSLQVQVDTIITHASHLDNLLSGSMMNEQTAALSRTNEAQTQTGLIKCKKPAIIDIDETYTSDRSCDST